MNGALLGATITAILTVIVGLSARRTQRTAQRVEETPRTMMGALRPGFREISGRVVATGDMLTAPLSRTPCVHYQFIVQEKVSRPRVGFGASTSSEHWRELIRDERTTAFSLEDGTGQCDVFLDGAELMLATSNGGYTDLFHDAPPDLEEVLQARYGVSIRALFFNRTLRYSERVIRESDTLYVLGTVRGGPFGRMQIMKGDDVLIVADREERLVLAALQRRAILLGFITVTLTAVTLALLYRGFLLP